MKRRAFTFGLAALAATPAVPFSAAVTPGTSADQHFSLAKLLARAHNHCSPAMLQRHLKVSPEMAREVVSLLLQRGVITPPVAGVSMATNPMNTNCVPKEALKPSNLNTAVNEVRERVQKILKARKEASLSEDDVPASGDIDSAVEGGDDVQIP